jgi:polysaccharide deacetylase 2 family uncharacterized protein YibQ
MVAAAVPGHAVVADDLGKSNGRTGIRFRPLPPSTTVPVAQSLMNSRESADSQT